MVNCADYGVPQTRRLITIFTRDPQGIEYFNDKGTFLPAYTHSEKGENQRIPWVSLRDAIGKLPELSAEEGKNEDKHFNPYHVVPTLSAEKLFWISHTPEGCTAFNNQCCNPECMYNNNPVHGSNYDAKIKEIEKLQKELKSLKLLYFFADFVISSVLQRFDACMLAI